MPTKNFWQPSWSTFAQNSGHSLGALYAEAQESCLLWEAGEGWALKTHIHSWDTEPVVAVKRGNHRKLSLCPLVSWVMQRCGQRPSMQMERLHSLQLPPHNLPPAPHHIMQPRGGMWRRKAGISICHSRMAFPVNPRGKSKDKTLPVWKAHILSLVPALHPSPDEAVPWEQCWQIGVSHWGPCSHLSIGNDPGGQYQNQGAGGRPGAYGV